MKQSVFGAIFIISLFINNIIRSLFPLSRLPVAKIPVGRLGRFDL